MKNSINDKEKRDEARGQKKPTPIDKVVESTKEKVHDTLVKGKK